MSNLVIKNNSTALIELPGVPPKQDKNGKVIREGYIPYRLQPGENDVPSGCWDLVKGNSAVKIWLATGKIENAGEGKATSILADIGKISPGDALRYIANCEQVALLNKWKAGTDKRGLKTAIDERLLELVHSQTGDPTPPPADAEEPFTEATLT